jgi:hypothetical protein
MENEKEKVFQDTTIISKHRYMDGMFLANIRTRFFTLADTYLIVKFDQRKSESHTTSKVVHNCYQSFYFRRYYQGEF